MNMDIKTINYLDDIFLVERNSWVNICGQSVQFLGIRKTPEGRVIDVLQYDTSRRQMQSGVYYVGESGKITKERCTETPAIEERKNSADELLNQALLGFSKATKMLKEKNKTRRAA